jgi:hypothetical protein
VDPAAFGCQSKPVEADPFDTIFGGMIDCAISVLRDAVRHRFNPREPQPKVCQIWSLKSSYGPILITYQPTGGLAYMGDAVQFSERLPIASNSDHSANQAVQSWSEMKPSGLTSSQLQESSQMHRQGFLDFSVGDPLMIAQANTAASKETFESWTNSHPLHGSDHAYANPDDAAKAAFTQNKLEQRSQQTDKEFGFWVYPILSKTGAVEGWGYTEPFMSSSKTDTVITHQDWTGHPFPQGSDALPGAIRQGHTHPHSRPVGELRPGYESFSQQDLNKINNSNPAYCLPSYLENANYEIRKRSPGETQDTVIGSDSKL